ncbi:MAG TPA: hypothetical protein VKR06_31710 [Ktedonosporobacter sp.]|nr:hypothetical protein [Ktedonosporobacter sp.]
MSVKVFFLGRPGSGKTTAARYIVELAQRRNFVAHRMKDYDILLDMFRKDDGQKFRPAEYGGFDVLDFSVIDDALLQLEEKVEEVCTLKYENLIAIEFARDNYRETLRKLKPDFLKDAYFFCVDADLDTCIQRIHQRISNPPQPDYHYVSTHIMQTYYSKDDWDYLSLHLKQEYPACKEVLAFRNTGSLDELYTVASDFAEHIFKKEFVTSGTASLPVGNQVNA